MGIGIEYIFTGLGAVSHVTGFSKMMTGLPGGDRMQRVEQNVEMLERGSGVKRPQVGGQRMFVGHYGKIITLSINKNLLKLLER